MRDIPTLTTARLVLRAWREDDLDAFAEIQADDRAARWLGGRRSRDDSWRGMALHLGHWALRGYGQWVVADRAGGRMLGCAGLWRPEGWPGLEVGWLIHPDHWGRGYATEAGRASLDWAFTALGADEAISITLPGNTASRRVMTKIGLTFDRDERVGDLDQVVYRITHSEWRAGAPGASGG